MPQPEPLTLGQVAALLGVSRRTVTERIREGVIRAEKSGPHQQSPVRVAPEALRAYLQSEGVSQ